MSLPIRRMRIAQLAPLSVPVPPVGYGGTERVVSVLTEELVRRGHDVTLFAAGTSDPERPPPRPSYTQRNESQNGFPTCRQIRR